MMAGLFYFNLRKVELCWLLILGYSTVKAVSEAKRMTMPSVVGCTRNAC